jgi:hypothetical protein
MNEGVPTGQDVWHRNDDIRLLFDKPNPSDAEMVEQIDAQLRRYETYRNSRNPDCIYSYKLTSHEIREKGERSLSRY